MAPQAAAAAPVGAGGFQFNKMFIMLPVMLLARKLDGEDPQTVLLLRIAYGCLQCIAVAIVAYVYYLAHTLSSNNPAAQLTIYVPPAPTPFADPTATKQKYTEVKFGTHILTTARSLLTSTLFGICMTVGLHYYKGMIVGLAMQTILTPFNLAENPLLKAWFLNCVWKKVQKQRKKQSSNHKKDDDAPQQYGDDYDDTDVFNSSDRMFNEKLLSELQPDDEIVDEQGNAVMVRQRRLGGGADGSSRKSNDDGSKAGGDESSSSQPNNNTASSSETKSLEDVLLDTWDAGNKADVSQLMKVLNESNCNYQTKEDSWTPLMVLAGLGTIVPPAAGETPSSPATPTTSGGTASAIRHVLGLGADATMTDKEGWTAFHWAAFHGSAVAAKELANNQMLLENSIVSKVLQVKDKDGNTPLDTAQKEKNDDVALIFEQAEKDAAAAAPPSGEAKKEQ